MVRPSAHALPNTMKFTTAVAAALMAFAQLAAADEDLMVACYTTVPVGVPLDRCGITHLHRRELQETTQSAPVIACEEYCSGWADNQFCAEYMCNKDTSGRVCDSVYDENDEVVVLGLVDEAKQAFIEAAEDTKCKGLMQKLACTCIDQNDG